MRLDKFLKVSRLIKRRSVAGDACRGDRVFLNGKEAKPAKEVKAGDILTVYFGDKSLTVRVLTVPEGQVAKKESDGLYEIIPSEGNT